MGRAQHSPKAIGPTAHATMPELIWLQKELVLPARPRGVHLVTSELVSAVPELITVTHGLMHLLLLHTSAALALNERVEPEVRRDLEDFLDGLAPDDRRLYQHSHEGPDDMPAHIKSVLIGPQLTIPVLDGALKLGTWQGLYLFEFRDQGGPRRVFVTLNGQTRSSQTGD